MAHGIHQPLTNGDDALSTRDGNKLMETNVCKRWTVDRNKSIGNLEERKWELDK